MLEAARIDGASEGQILRQIVLPILTPIIVTLALYVFLSSWNDFMWPLIILADQDLYTLPVALAANSRQNVRSEEHTSELQSLMRISYAVFCLKKNININQQQITTNET